MNFEELQHQLLICFASTDPTIQNAANTANQYTELLKTGQISKEEYQQLLQDIQSTIVISENMQELEAKERLNVAINGLINLASLV